MKVNNLFNIGQLLYTVDENSITVVEVKDWTYTSSLKETLYILSYLHSKVSFEYYEGALYAFINEDIEEDTEQWFDNYDNACKCLQRRIEKYQKNLEDY